MRRNLAVVVLAMILAGCSGADRSGAPGAGSSTWTASSDHAGQQVCDAVKAVAGDPAAADPGPLIKAGEAGTASTQALLPIASDALARAAKQVRDAVASGSADEASLRKQMGTNVTVVSAICEGAGYFPPA